MIALDAIEITLVRRGIEEGWLPNIAEFAGQGPSVEISHPIPELPGSSWPTTNFGSGPDEHHVIFDRQLIPGSYEIADFPSEAMHSQPFWKHLSDAGFRSTITSVYGNRIVEGLNGTQVIGWGSYDPFSAKLRGPRSDPPRMIDRLNAEIPRRRSGFIPSLPRRERDFRVYKKETLDQIGLQGQGLEFLMRETDWDFFYGAYCHPHEYGHLAWHRPTDIEDVYKALDADLSRLFEACPQDALVFLMTPHGMGPNLVGRGALDLVLQREGWLVKAPHRPSAKTTALALASSIYRHLPYEARWKLGQRLPVGRWENDNSLLGVDWSRTKAFTLPHDKTALIRLNLKGREPNGIVQPGGDYDRTIEEISEGLRGLTDPASGRNMVADIKRMDTVLGGPVGSVFPDIIVLWEDILSEGLASDRVGEVMPTVRDIRTGDHPPVGFLMGAGPGLSPSGELFKSVDAVLPDVAATILSLFGCELPAEITGTNLEAFAT